MRLRKSLYGISPASANWHGTIVDFVITTGFTPLMPDPCIYIYNPTTNKGPTFASWNKETVLLTIYVDDGLLEGQNKVLLEKLEEKLLRRFDTKCMGDVSMVRGMQVTRDREKETLNNSQTHYTKSVPEMYTAWRSVNRCTRSESGQNYRSSREKEPSDYSTHAAVPVYRR